MRVTRVSKCIWKVNGVRIDTRKSTRGWKFHGVRQAIFAYYLEKEPEIDWITVDKRVCQLMNKRDWKFWTALEGNATV